MRNINRLAAVVELSIVVWFSAPADAAPLLPKPQLPFCNEEVVYGTAIVDWSLRAFALRGTGYVFVVSEEIALEDIDGQQVRIEIAPDCSVRDVRVIGLDDDAIL